MLSTSWFVSPSGSNQNPGTVSAPFQTIQAAANVAQPGDDVEIETGTYHETITPKYSGTSANPIVYEAFDNENVTVSGADPITGWTQSASGNNVYQSPMSWDLGEGNNQVFVDGTAINEARWPNTSLDLMHPTLATASKVSLSGNSVTLYNASLNQAANYWKGAIINILPGNAWVAETDTITSSAPGQITFNFVPMKTSASYMIPEAGNSFYLTNSFKALDGPGEWYRDPTSGTLYVSTPAGDSPANHDIEVKHRDYAFNLSNNAYTTIQGINIFSATILTSAKSAGTVLNGLHAEYISQFLILPSLFYTPGDTGIQLNGPSSVLENSTIAYSAGDGVFVDGADSRVTNNVIHDVDYSASNSAAIRIYGSGSEIDHNTIYNTGRNGILMQAPRLQVLYNTLYDIGLSTTEAGGIYTVGINGGGAVIAYNNISDMHGGGYGQKALFLDNNSSNFVVHDNTTSNVDVALGLNFNSLYNDIYNNTLSGSQFAVGCNTGAYWGGTRLTNNILIGPTHFGTGVILKNNATTQGVVGTGPASFSSGAASNIVDVPIGVPQPAAPATAVPTNGSTTPPVVGSSSAPTSPAVGSAPVTTTTPATTVADDRAAIVADMKARKTLLAQWSATVRADMAQYRAANHQLNAEMRKAKHPGQNVVPADFTDLSDEVLDMRHQTQIDRATLATDRRTDVTGIRNARRKLAADLKSLAAARR